MKPIRIIEDIADESDSAEDAENDHLLSEMHDASSDVNSPLWNGRNSSSKVETGSKKKMGIFRIVLTSGSGFFTDSYDLFSIGLIIPILEYLYYDTHKMPDWEKGVLAGISLVGTLCGQLIFGFLGDILGRKRAFILSSTLIMLASLGSALAYPIGSASIMVLLILWRGILGVGIGGDYPLAACISSEFSEASTRGRVIATVFATQGFGILAAALVTTASLAICGPSRLALAWRMTLLFGCFAAVVTFYFRLTMEETPQYEKKHQHDQLQQGHGQEQGAPEKPTPSAMQLLKERWKLLAATASTWFLLDVAFYAQNLFNPVVLQAIGLSSPKESWTSEQDLYNAVMRTCLGQVLIALFGTVPGYWVTVATIDRIGRRTIQIMGFSVMAFLFGSLTIFYEFLTGSGGSMVVLFLVIYGLTFFFANWGPNPTTFILPSELFPTAIRSRAHGVSAATGKAGAIVAAFSFPACVTAFGVGPVLGAICVCLIAGSLITYFLIPETMGKTLEELETAFKPKMASSLEMHSLSTMATHTQSSVNSIS